VFHFFYIQFLQENFAPLFIHATRSQSCSINWYYYLKIMSLTLNSLRKIAHASIVGGAPALLMRASKISQTILHQRSRSTFSTMVRQEAPRAVTVPQKLRTDRMRQRFRSKKISARLVYQRQPRRLAITTYRSSQSGWTWFWRLFSRTFWVSLLISMYRECCKRSVKTIGKSQPKYQLTLNMQYKGRVLPRNKCPAR
jgi:hypothetical protein